MSGMGFTFGLFYLFLHCAQKCAYSAYTTGSAAGIPSVLRVSALTEDPLAVSPSGAADHPGFFIDLLNKLQSNISRPCALTLRSNIGYGAKLADGSWNGLIGLLLNNFIPSGSTLEEHVFQKGFASTSHAVLGVFPGLTETDIIGPAIFNMWDTEELVDFLTPIYEYKVQVLYNIQSGMNAQTIYYALDSDTLSLICGSSSSSAQAACTSISARGADGMVSSGAAGVAKVLSGNFGFVCDSVLLSSLQATYAGKAQAQTVLSVFAGFAVQLGSPLRKMLNVPLLQFAENGDIQMLFDKYGVPT